MKFAVLKFVAFFCVVGMLSVHCHGFQKYEQRTLLTSVPCETSFKLDFTRLMDDGEFTLTSGPDRFRISKEGVADWRPSKGDQGKNFKAKFVVDRAGQLTGYSYTLHVSKKGERTAVLTADEPKLVAIEKGQFQWYPDAFQSGKKTQGSFANLSGEGKFLLLEGPERIELAADGSFNWIPNLSKQETVKIIVQRVKGSGDKQFLYAKLFVMERHSSYKIHKPALAFQEFESEIYPTTVPTGENFNFDFTQEMKAGKFTLVAAPDGFKISEKGVTDFYPGNGRHGDKAEIKFQVDRSGELSNYAYTFEFSRDRPRMVAGANQPSNGTSSRDLGNMERSSPKQPVVQLEGVAFDWYPKSIQTGKVCREDLARLAGKGDFLLLDGARNFKISKSGKIEWDARNGNVGIQKTVIRQSRASKPDRFIYVKFLVEREPSRKIQSELVATLEREDNEPRAEIDVLHTVLECPQPEGWILMPDKSTLVVSDPAEAQLIYFDTENEKEIERIDVDFQPNLLAFHRGKIVATAKGSSIIRVLDPKDGEIKKEIRTGSEAIVGLACHPVKGHVYASTSNYEILFVDIEKDKASPTNAKGHFLEVDPIAGEYLYAGIQPRNKRELKVEVTEDDDTTKFRFFRDTWGTRAAMMRYQVKDQKLKLQETQDNAAVNGRSFHLTPDGKRVMITGGGGWRPKTEGTGGGYVTAIFRSANLGERVGQVPSGTGIIFHPILKMGVINDQGWQLKPFKDNAYVLKPAIILDEKFETNREPQLLTFCAHGSKVATWNGSDINERKGLHIVPLKLTDKERAQLPKTP